METLRVHNKFENGTPVRYVIDRRGIVWRSEYCKVECKWINRKQVPFVPVETSEIEKQVEGE